jgi:hypothetical protein
MDHNGGQKWRAEKRVTETRVSWRLFGALPRFKELRRSLNFSTLMHTHTSACVHEGEYIQVHTSTDFSPTGNILLPIHLDLTFYKLHQLQSSTCPEALHILITVLPGSREEWAGPKSSCH